MSESLDTWFKREILVHEHLLVNFLSRSWRRPQEIDDLRQEIYVKAYEAARASRPHSPKAFLFIVARHLVIDRIRRARVISIESVGDFDESTVSMDELSPERRLDARQQLKRLAEALNALPPKCRQVIWMRRIDELSQKEVAERLGVSVRTVESHALKGMHLLADSLLAQNTLPKPNGFNTASDNGNQHGQRKRD